MDLKSYNNFLKSYRDQNLTNIGSEFKKQFLTHTVKVINESLNELTIALKTLKNVIYLPIQIKKIVFNVLIFQER